MDGGRRGRAPLRHRASHRRRAGVGLRPGLFDRSPRQGARRGDGARLDNRRHEERVGPPPSNWSESAMTPIAVRQIAVGAGVAILGVTSSAWADDAVDLRPTDDWSFTIEPYAWAAGMKGTAATLPPLPPIKVDASFSDILKNLDIAAMVGAELRYQKFAAYADIIYTDISADANTPRGILFDNIRVESQV